MIGPIFVIGAGVIACSGCNRADVDSVRADGSSGQVSSSDPGADVSGDMLRSASRSLSRGDLNAAEEAIKSHMLISPGDIQALELAGDIAAMRGDAATSCEMYRAAVDGSSIPSEQLLDKLAQQSMRSGRPFDAVDTLLESIAHHPDQVQTRFDLAGLATMIGLTDAAVPSLEWLAQRRHGDPESLLVMADPGAVEPDVEICGKLKEQSPDDLRAEYCFAKLDAIKQD